jgi:hypothetical protein
MVEMEAVVPELYGMFRDVLTDADGRVTWDSGWQKNAIVVDCRRLLAAFMRGAPSTALGIQGLQVGYGLDAWDATGPPPPNPAQTALVDPTPHLVPRASLTLDFMAGAVVSGTPTNRLQVVATLGPGVPPWPEPGAAPPHPSSTLREFGLVADLNGAAVLINYRTHPAIAKDPFSTLTRTIWLVF